MVSIKFWRGKFSRPATGFECIAHAQTFDRGVVGVTSWIRLGTNPSNVRVQYIDALSLIACDVNNQYSDYFSCLEGPAKSRYQEKITVCGFDPYALRKRNFSENIELLPNVQYPDIVNYLVLQPSWATKTQMKAYKSMDAYNFFMSRWVNTLCIRSVDAGKVVVFARVSC